MNNDKNNKARIRSNSLLDFGGRYGNDAMTNEFICLGMRISDNTILFRLDNGTEHVSVPRDNLKYWYRIIR